MQHWYVYYKLSADRLPQVSQQVRAMQAQLAATLGVHGRLLCRADQTADPLTLMEIYDSVAAPAAFEAQLAAAAAAAGLPASLISARHIERFREL